MMTPQTMQDPFKDRFQLTTHEAAVVEQILRDAGWLPGRLDNRVNDWAAQLGEVGWEMFPAARAALTEYGGLKVYVDGAGVHRGRTSFEIDPALTLGDEDVLQDFATTLGVRWYPVGDIRGGGTLMVDEAGTAYIYRDHEVFGTYPSMAVAVGWLIVGRTSAP